jgi:hypothetical protein
MVKKENIYFITFVDDNLQDKLTFKDEVISILSHKNGWSKYGYNFICINNWDISASSNAIINNIYSSGGASSALNADAANANAANANTDANANAANANTDADANAANAANADADDANANDADAANANDAGANANDANTSDTDAGANANDANTSDTDAGANANDANVNTNDANNTRKYPILKIFLKSANQTDKDCGMQGFSCTRFTDNYNPIDIIINYDNWCGKSKSSLSIPDYRKYVINHEVGHWLGLDHTECPIDQCIAMGLKECPASIMLQMTRGPDFIKPCKEQPNPLDPIFKIDNPKISKYKFKRGGDYNKKYKYKYLIILIIILLIFFIIILYINIKKLKITYNSIFK